MAKTAKSAGSKRSSNKFERTVVYRGIKIPPIIGRRSATAEAIRDALQAQAEHLRGKPVRN